MKRDIWILGVHDGHNCGATIIKNGIVIASINEERITGNKNEVGFPEKSILEVIKIAGIDFQDLDEIVYASLFMHSPDYLKDLEPWYIVGIEQQRQAELKSKKYQQAVFEQRKKERIEKRKQNEYC